MQEKAEMWVGRWFIAMFVVMIATALWQRGRAADDVRGIPATSYSKVYVGRFTVSKGDREGSVIPPGKCGLVPVTLRSQGPDDAGKDGYQWYINPPIAGGTCATYLQPAGWRVNGIPTYYTVDDALALSVVVPPSVAPGEYVLAISLCSKTDDAAAPSE